MTDLVAPDAVLVPPAPTDTPVAGGYTLAHMIQRVRQVLRPMANAHDLPSLGKQGLTLADMRARVRAVLRDDNAQFISNVEIDAHLNEAAEHLAARARAIRAQATGFTSGTITLPATFLEFLRLEVAGKPVDLITSDEMWYDWKDGQATSPRVLARMVGSTIELFPQLAHSSTYSLHYVSRPSTLTGTGDQVELPVSLQVQMIQYARAQAKLKEADYPAYERYMGLYDHSAPAVATDILRPDPQTAQGRPPVPEAKPITDYEITDYLNEGLLDLAFRTESVRREATGTTTDNLITLPDHYLRALTLRLGTDDVQFTDDQSWYDWSDSTAVPVHSIARVFGASIEVYPTPSTGTAWTLRYVSRPTELVLGTDQPDVPVALQTKAIDYARSRCKMMEGDFNASDRYMALYTGGLPSGNIKERVFQGPLQLIPDPGPFDTFDARHQ